MGQTNGSYAACAGGDARSGSSADPGQLLATQEVKQAIASGHGLEHDPPSMAATYIGSYLLATVVIMTLFGAMFGRLSQAFGERFLPSFLTLVGAGSILISAVWLCLNLAG